ncbi:hypothetical protein BKA57DRAFT_468769 [Linnemannia elongata]|nr:hypothetical protein BKA57DRAFT_468769 [Linnemannia elongata]
MEASTFHYSTTSQSIHPKEDITDHQSAINFGTRPGHSPACYFISTPTSLFCSFHFFFFSILGLSFSSSSFFFIIIPSLTPQNLHSYTIFHPYSTHTLASLLYSHPYLHFLSHTHSPLQPLQYSSSVDPFLFPVFFNLSLRHNNPTTIVPSNHSLTHASPTLSLTSTLIPIFLPSTDNSFNSQLSPLSLPHTLASL